MWQERFVIVITEPRATTTCRPIGAISSQHFGTGRRSAGTIGLFLTVFFLFLRFVPIVSIAEVREIIEGEKIQMSEPLRHYRCF